MAGHQEHKKKAKEATTTTATAITAATAVAVGQVKSGKAWAPPWSIRNRHKSVDTGIDGVKAEKDRKLQNRKKLKEKILRRFQSTRCMSRPKAFCSKEGPMTPDDHLWHLPPQTLAPSIPCSTAPDVTSPASSNVYLKLGSNPDDTYSESVYHSDCTPSPHPVTPVHDYENDITSAGNALATPRTRFTPPPRLSPNPRKSPALPPPLNPPNTRAYLSQQHLQEQRQRSRHSRCDASSTTPTSSPHTSLLLSSPHTSLLLSSPDTKDRDENYYEIDASPRLLLTTKSTRSRSETHLYDPTLQLSPTSPQYWSDTGATARTSLESASSLGTLTLSDPADPALDSSDDHYTTAVTTPKHIYLNEECDPSFTPPAAAPPTDEDTALDPLLRGTKRSNSFIYLNKQCDPSYSPPPPPLPPPPTDEDVTLRPFADTDKFIYANQQCDPSFKLDSLVAEEGVEEGLGMSTPDTLAPCPYVNVPLSRSPSGGPRLGIPGYYDDHHPATDRGDVPPLLPSRGCTPLKGAGFIGNPLMGRMLSNVTGVLPLPSVCPTPVALLSDRYPHKPTGELLADLTQTDAHFSQQLGADLLPGLNGITPALSLIGHELTWNQTQQKDIHHSLLDHLDTEKSLIRRNLSRYSDEFEKLKATLRSLHFDLDTINELRQMFDTEMKAAMDVSLIELYNCEIEHECEANYKRKTWICTSCTFINSHRNFTCKACRLPMMCKI